VTIAAQFLKYVFVAALSAASDWLVFAALFTAFSSPILAQATSRIFGAAVSFGVNKYWSFQSPRHRQALIEGPRFFALFIASYTLSLSLFSMSTFSGMSPWLAKLATDTICFFFNFLVMRFWVYRPHQPVQDGQGTQAAAFQPNRLSAIELQADDGMSSLR
jgi:putative flippase GtrA